MIRLLANARIRTAQLEAIRAVSPELEVVRPKDDAEAAELFREAEILFTYQLPGPLANAPRLKWVQLTSAGAEHLLEAVQEGRPDLLVTTASGIHRVPIAEFVVWAMITLSRRLGQVLRESSARQWQPQPPRFYYGEEIRGKTLGVLGLGAIGREVAAVGRAMGMRTLGFRRSGGSAEEAGADGLFGPEGLDAMLPQCDFLVVALPLTPETTGLLGERELRAMKPTGYLVNVARGAIVEQEALVRALREGWIAGAALDVFAEEPLPESSELWGLPNLVITPHLAGATMPYLERATDVFIENLRRYLAGGEMVNLLDRKKGY